LKPLLDSVPYSEAKQPAPQYLYKPVFLFPKSQS